MSDVITRAIQEKAETSSAPPDVDLEAPFDGEVTVYLRSSAPDVARERQRATLDRIEQLRAAGALEDVEIVRWQGKVSEPADGPGSETIVCYEEFVEAVGSQSLEPFFKQRPGVGRLDRVVVLPVICIAARRDGELVGVYPRWNDGVHESIEDALDALAEGEIENV